MKTKPMETKILSAAILTATLLAPALRAEEAGSGHSLPGTGGQATVNADATRPASWLERDTLTGDWGGSRTWLKYHGITLAPRLTQFYQGLTAGDGDRNFKYGGKADLLLNADLSKLGLWKGLSVTVHAEYNFGQSVNGDGGMLVPANTALLFPGMKDADAYDLSSVYIQQQFGDSVTLLIGKMNMMDLAAKKPFMGGAGIDSFQNLTFVAPPTGVVPPYLFGAMMTVRTEPAIFGLWVYDPNSVVNKTGFEEPFANGVNIRGSVDFPVTIGGLSGRQGFVALYSTEPGTDLNDIGDTFLPPFPQPDTKDSRYYFAYSFDQTLYKVSENSKEGFGIFGQFGISDGNPSKLYWSALVGIGGTGLIPGRSRDNWGIAYYYDAPSSDLKESLSPSRTRRPSDARPNAPSRDLQKPLSPSQTQGPSAASPTAPSPDSQKPLSPSQTQRPSDAKPNAPSGPLSPLRTIRDEQGLEIFYNFEVTPWFTVGADLQVISPFVEKDTAVIFGLRSVIRF